MDRRPGEGQTRIHNRYKPAGVLPDCISRVSRLAGGGQVWSTGTSPVPRAPTLLVVEDDALLATMIADYLRPHDLDVAIEARGDRAVARVLEERPDLLILDLTLPGEDGLSVCRRVRPGYDGPILMLTARGEAADEVMGLDVGADDYLVKPVRPRVLLARVRALLRRPSAGVAAVSLERVTVGDLFVDPVAREARMGACRLDLTSGELDLLWLLASNAGTPLTRRAIHARLIGGDYDRFDRAIDLRVSRLRHKLDSASGTGAHIQSIRGVGYLYTRG